MANGCGAKMCDVEVDIEGLDKMPSPCEEAVVFALKGDDVPSFYADLTHVCPSCDGYGRQFITFEDGRMSKDCEHCYGWGWVEKEYSTHVHQWVDTVDGPLFTFDKFCTECNAVNDTGNKRRGSLLYRMRLLALGE